MSGSISTTAWPAETAPGLGLNSALAALREGDTLVVPKLDRLARSVPDAREIGDSLKGKAPKLSPTKRTVLLKLHRAGEHSIAELAELFSVSRATVYREIARTQPKTPATGVR